MGSPRIITSPVRLTGNIHPQQLASLVAIDAAMRRRRDRDLPTAEWELTTLRGDVAVQRAVERAVVRSGDSPDELGREVFAERAVEHELNAHSDLRRLLAAIDVGADLDRWGPESQEATRAARVAFVRLYEAGLLVRSHAVLDACPSCHTVVDEADADHVEIDGERFTFNLPVGDHSVEVDTFEPELLVGAVALALPAETQLSGSVVLPILDQEIPLVTVEGLQAPVVVVPGHDRWSHDLARQMGWPTVEVLDGEGVIRHPGPLEGLSRYAGRSAAVEILAADGYLSAQTAAPHRVVRCHRCQSVLVALLGSHWVLSFSQLAEPLVEAVRSGAIAFSPTPALDTFVAAAERSVSWCVSQQLRSGHQIPVSSCLDCGSTTVAVDMSSECPTCMGTLRPQPDVLDARFIAAITPLAMMGWPSQIDGGVGVDTTLFVGPAGIETWALPMAVLGLRLCDAVPFSSIVVSAPNHPEGVDPGQLSIFQAIASVESCGSAVSRAALMLDEPIDSEAAVEVVELLRNPTRGSRDVGSLVEPYDKALDALDASGAIAVLLNVAREGIADSAVPHLAQLVRPLLGD